MIKGKKLKVVSETRKMKNTQIIYQDIGTLSATGYKNATNALPNLI